MGLSVILFWTLLIFTIAQRLLELRIAKRNMKSLEQRGGVEFGASHYWVFIVLHSCFFISLIVEHYSQKSQLASLWYFWLAIYILAQCGRVWVIRSMRGRWTTRVIVIKGESLVSRGPYRFIRHPNYAIVALELAALPLIFGLDYTALIFTIANAFVILGVRLPVERTALDWSQS